MFVAARYATALGGSMAIRRAIPGEERPVGMLQVRNGRSVALGYVFGELSGPPRGESMGLGGHEASPEALRWRLPRKKCREPRLDPGDQSARLIDSVLPGSCCLSTVTEVLLGFGDGSSTD